MKNLTDTKKIIKYLKKHIRDKRLSHTMGTAEYSIKMAKIYKVNEKKAEVAALLHDCAKEESDKSLLKLSKAYGFEIDEMYLEIPQLLHGVAAAQISKEKFKITDEDILEAICYHTVPKPDMCDLAKIIYIADKIEKTRRFHDIKEIREAVDKHKSLSDIFLMTLKRVKLSHIINNKPLHPSSLTTYNYIVSNM